MSLTNQPDETFITQFAELGITDSNEMITILDGFEQIAEIGYEWYVNNNLMKRTNTND